MRIRWRGLELPSRVELDESVSTNLYGRFLVEPFERGFGTTIGNSLRRVLLSSLEGAAVTTVRIAGAPHEFASLPGILEDVTDILLNVKRITVRSESDSVKTMRVSRTTKGVVRAGDIETDAALSIVNPDQHICTVTGDRPFDMEMTVRRGRGYASAEENRSSEQELGVIPVDSVYTPIERVRYRTEDTRVGQKTNYDRLILEVWTRGSVTPSDALVEAAKILRKHLNPFVMYHDLGDEVVASVQAGEEAAETPVDYELQQKWNLPISALNLSVRASNCLESARIQTIGDLVSKSESELLRLRAFGKTSLREVRRQLAEHGLSLMPGRGQSGSMVNESSGERRSVPVHTE